jgi:hypothetical protein
MRTINNRSYVKEWTAVLMLTDIKSPSLYMQAAFRAQNPFKQFRNGELVLKNRPICLILPQLVYLKYMTSLLMA